MQIISNEKQSPKSLYPYGILDMDEAYERAIRKALSANWQNFSDSPRFLEDERGGIFKDVYNALKKENLIDEIFAKLCNATYAVWAETSSRDVGTVELDDSMQALHELAECELYAFHVNVKKVNGLTLRCADYQVLIGERIIHLWIDKCDMIKKILSAGKVNAMYDDTSLNYGDVSLPNAVIPEWHTMPETSIPLPTFLERLERDPPNPWIWTANINITGTYPTSTMPRNFKILASRLGD